MFCPQCGQERTSDATSYGSRCGFLLTGTADILRTGGLAVPSGRACEHHKSRREGIKQGIFIFLLTFLVAPLVGIIFVFGLRMEPWPVGVVVFLFGVGGLLRIIHALMFGTTEEHPALPSPPAAFGEFAPETATLPRLDAGVRDYVSPFNVPPRDTNDLEPASVTESTTKLLEKDAPTR